MHESRDIPVAELVPQAGAMCLLDKVLSADAETLSAQVTIRADGLFFHDGAVGAWVGMEYMAQAIAAWAGWQARQQAQPPKIGFLLGCRRYVSHRPSYALGETLQIHVARQFQAENGLGQFDCRIEIEQTLVATAALTVYEPQDAAVFLEEMGHG